MRSLINKARKTFSDEGALAAVRKTKNYLLFKIKTGLKKGEMKDILFINGCTLPHPARYRVEHQAEQLEANGLSVDKISYTEVDPNKVKFYRSIIIFRCPITEEIRKIINKAHYFNKKVFYDVDDLVIDTKYTDHIEFVQQMNRQDRKIYDDGVIRMGETMKMCDYCITTTSALARELKKYNKDVYVNRNVASERMVALSLAAMKKIKKNEDTIKIGYLSGSITHNPDFEMIKPVLIKVLTDFNNVELVLMGHLDLPEELKQFENRIVKKPFENWENLPNVIAELDINLAPIEKSIFNEAKSENKWMEAALCKVVTVASDFGAFKEVIEDGKTGMLCKNNDDWYERIKQLIKDSNLRRKIAENAHEVVMDKYITTYSGLGLKKFVESKMARNVAFVLPSTNISGGVNVVLKHCDILRRKGLDVMVINMDKSDNNFVNDDGEVNVVSALKHDIMAKFDTQVATLFTTLKYIKEYPYVKNKFYLVQNFETDFNEYGSPARKEANATYSEEDVCYLTISKWCQEWLKKNYNQTAKYAPNGINLSKFECKERKMGKKIKILIEGNSDDYYKNVDESFKVVQKLDSRKFEIVYLSYQGEPKKWYKVDKFYHRVPHDEVGKIYGECDILLKTSILESFSYPPLEMMATGGYVVAVPNAGNIEYLKDNENCLFYEKGNINEALIQIEKIVDDEKLRKKLFENGRKTVIAREWGKIENEIWDLYQ